MRANKTVPSPYVKIAHGCSPPPPRCQDVSPYSRERTDFSAELLPSLSRRLPYPTHQEIVAGFQNVGALERDKVDLLSRPKRGSFRDRARHSRFPLTRICPNLLRCTSDIASLARAFRAGTPLSSRASIYGDPGGENLSAESKSTPRSEGNATFIDLLNKKERKKNGRGDDGTLSSVLCLRDSGGFSGA